MVVVLIFAFYDQEAIVAPVQVTYLCPKMQRLVFIHPVSQDNHYHMTIQFWC